MSYWIFKCNPDRYKLEERLADPNPTLTWFVSRYGEEIGPGDTAFLWVTGKQRGIRAVMRVDEAPRIMAEMESERAYWTGEEIEEELRVVGTLTHRNINLTHYELREVPGLEDLSVFHGFQQGTNFPVTPEQASIILRLVRGSLAEYSIERR